MASFTCLTEIPISNGFTKNRLCYWEMSQFSETVHLKLLVNRNFSETVTWPSLHHLTFLNSSFGILTGVMCCTPGEVSSRQFFHFCKCPGVWGNWRCEACYLRFFWRIAELPPVWQLPYQTSSGCQLQSNDVNSPAKQRQGQRSCRNDLNDQV